MTTVTFSVAGHGWKPVFHRACRATCCRRTFRRTDLTPCRPKTLEGASPVSGPACLLFPTLRSARSRPALPTRRD